MDLTKKKCVPCEGGVPPLTAEQIAELLPQLKDWQVIENKKIAKHFKFKDFTESMAFVNAVARVADADDHHPDITVYYNKVELVLWTHATHGLSENDFIVAAKIDAIKFDPKHISIDDVSKVEIKIGTIVSAEKVEGSDKLLKFSVDFGNSEVRSIVSGVAQSYQPEQMLGKQVPVITNLAPRMLKGVESNGMALYAIDNTVFDGLAQHKPIMLNPEREVPPGSVVR